VRFYNTFDFTRNSQGSRSIPSRGVLTALEKVAQGVHIAISHAAVKEGGEAAHPPERMRPKVGRLQKKTLRGSSCSIAWRINLLRRRRRVSTWYSKACSGGNGILTPQRNETLRSATLFVSRTSTMGPKKGTHGVIERRGDSRTTASYDTVRLTERIKEQYCSKRLLCTCI
jgi:hypothetical protein